MLFILFFCPLSIDDSICLHPEQQMEHIWQVSRSPFSLIMKLLAGRWPRGATAANGEPSGTAVKLQIKHSFSRPESGLGNLIMYGVQRRRGNVVEGD